MKKNDVMKKNTLEKVVIHELINFDYEPENDIKVSIVVPVCNVEQYLAECLESAINQNMKDIEIICVNDGSTDESLNILKHYAELDKRVKIVSKDNAGYGHTMNIGIDMAKGEYIGILESDDYVDLSMYGDLYEIAKKYELDWIKADFNRFVHENGELKCTYNSLASRKRELYNKVLNPKDEKIVFKFIMQTWSGIYSRQFLIDNSIRHNETPGASYQDNGFWFQSMIFAQKIMFYNKPYYMNRRDNPNSSVHNKGKVYCMNAEYDYIRTILEENIALKNQFLFQYSFKKFINYLFTYRRIGDEFKWEYLQKFTDELNVADARGEIDWGFYSESEKNEIQMVLNSPQDFYANEKIRFEKSDFEKKLENKCNEYERQLKDTNRKCDQLKNQISAREFELNCKQKYIYDLINSTSYKVGRIITSVPRWYKDKKILAEKLSNDLTNNIVHIVMITDSNYAMPTTVSLCSMKMNKYRRTIYKIHILATGLEGESKDKLMELNADDFQINIYEVEIEDVFKNMVKRDGDLHVSPAAIAKFKIPSLLNNIGKVIYLDGDTLVQRDLAELYNVHIPGKYAAVVKDIISERNPKHLRFLKYKNRWYFNSGMMVLNLTKLRKDNIAEKLIDYRINGINHFMDQDALNVVFKENVLYISPQYNFLNKFYEWWDGEKLSIFYRENIPEKELDAYKSAAVLHLGSHEKPWIYDMGYLSKLYKKYYNKSPYKNTKLHLLRLENANGK